MDINEAVKILNDATYKYDGLQFIHERPPNGNKWYSIELNNLIDGKKEAEDIVKALDVLLTYIYQNPPKKK